MDKLEKITEILENMDDDELVTIYNEYDYTIYNMDDFDELLSGVEPSEIARQIFYGDFNPNDDYFRYNGYGNLESFDDVRDYIYIDDLANDIWSNEYAYGNDEIQEILDENDDEE